MNDYDFLISKLKSMQIQGFNRSEIIDEWQKGSSNALICLEQKLVWAFLKNDSSEIKLLKFQIRNLQSLDKTINKGLLE
jgi:hypothetical protein